jgi:tRNA-splicing ligase RtcB
MKPKELVDIGLPKECLQDAFDAIRKNPFKPRDFRTWLVKMLLSPQEHTGHEHWGTLASSVINARAKTIQETETWGKNPYGPATFAQWGEKDDDNSIQQMRTACEVPVAVQGALMPDNHLGYGLPIGGVLATHNSVIPYAVGVDIACRMRMTITDLPVKVFEKELFTPKADTYIRAITGGTVFGVGGSQKMKANHSVMDMDWDVCKTTKQVRDTAWSQLGTSGSGNHFVEFGIVTLAQEDLGLPAGKYVALLSHSGSRRAGSEVCAMYSDIAKQKLPKAYEKFINLAWLSLDSEAGQEYWKAMNLMGEYAAANHFVIHQRVLELAGGKHLCVIENHHNFAWEEEHDGKKLIVHRKGATPAGKGVLGVIPGSMADPAFVVRGKGSIPSLLSASHGAGRQMSRRKAIETQNWARWKAEIIQRGVRVLSCGLDEVPGVYKDIYKVMAAQTDLVDVVAQFDPKLVKMSADGKSED